jgi:RimJ/RimL family protein N-acetyltransferase
MTIDHLEFTCTHATFRPDLRHPVRWIGVEADYARVRAYWPDELPREEWYSFADMGYTYAAVLEQDVIVAMGAVWHWSEVAWEAAAISTAESHRQRGYAAAIMTFLTQHILDSGRLATCGTAVNNIAMQRTMLHVGYQPKP